MSLLQENDYLIISNRNNGLYAGKGYLENDLSFVKHKFSKNGREKYNKEYLYQLENLIRKANSRNINVIYISPFPEFKYKTDFVLCTPQWFNKRRITNERACQAEISLLELNNRFDDKVTNSIQNFTKVFRNFQTIKFNTSFCILNEKKCRPTHIKSNIFIYRDGNHLDSRLSLYLTEDFINKLKIK